ncbi:hypothetical protein AB9K26_14165 [Psychroserpens sp. XS_ASV72]|uniref:hypothetical protein n=1 Tax=Psychroserpens sp. XS_ASV72 TaxID=3241293 RepID=UPI0035167C54
MMKYKIFGILLFCLTLNLHSQTKNEKESRIALDAFPEQSQNVITSITKDVRRIRHYKETDGENLSFETKFKYDKHWFSVEFNASGILEDIEVEIKERQIADDIRSKINSYLKTHYSKFDFLKIQEQYPFNDSKSPQQFLKSVLSQRKNTLSNYEIVVALKYDKDWQIKEMTFDENGIFLRERTLQQDSYEYIMY